MSVPNDTILPMIEKWTKYSYVCQGCDSLFEITCLDPKTYEPQCCGYMVNVSVVDATILSNTTKKEDNQMDTLTPAPQVMTLDWVENDITTTKTYTESDIRNMVWVNKNLTNKQNEWFKKESQLRTLLEEVYVDSQDQEVLAQIADIFDVPLTKEIEYTAWVRVDMTIEVELGSDVDAIEDFIAQNLTVDSYGSEINVSNYEIERTEEGAY